MKLLVFAGLLPDPFVSVLDDAGSEDIFVSGGVGGALPGQDWAGLVDAFVMKVRSG